MMVYHARQMGHVLGALREPVMNGSGSVVKDAPREDAEDVMVATILLQVWFSVLVGWSGGLFDAEGIVEQVRVAARVVLLGVREAR
jgi:hypothetical protein